MVEESLKSPLTLSALALYRVKVNIEGLLPRYENAHNSYFFLGESLLDPSTDTKSNKDLFADVYDHTMKLEQQLST